MSESSRKGSTHTSKPLAGSSKTAGSHTRGKSTPSKTPTPKRVGVSPARKNLPKDSAKEIGVIKTQKRTARGMPEFYTGSAFEKPRSRPTTETDGLPIKRDLLKKSLKKFVDSASDKKTNNLVDSINYESVYEMSEAEKIKILKNGINPNEVLIIAGDMGIGQLRLKEMLRLSKSTFTRRSRNDENLSIDQSERVLRLKSLIGLAQKLVNQFGNPSGFNTPQWVGEWIETPIPALANAKPADYLDTGEGVKLVESTLMRTVTGVSA